MVGEDRHDSIRELKENEAIRSVDDHHLHLEVAMMVGRSGGAGGNEKGRRRKRAVGWNKGSERRGGRLERCK
jgi:hypothetical protein